MRWKINSKLPNDLPQTERLFAILKHLYANRGLDDEQTRLSFLNDQPFNPDLLIKSLPDLDFSQLKSATKRIKQAIKDQQPIIIYGDYDCDGVCATAVLWQTLHKLGAKVMPFIPHRFDHGYGLSEKGLADALKLFLDNKPLIITVDNGIRAHIAAQILKDKQIDLIITDHHQKDKTLPQAYAHVHTTSLCGAGVAWVLSCQLTENVDTGLVALATVCDQLPLLGPNRILVKDGLRALRNHPGPGLLALYEVAQITQPENLDTYHLGFLLGPRINAAGRLGSALDALRLLCTSSSTNAAKYAQLLNSQNLTRQELTADYFQQAIAHFQQLETLPKLLFYTKDDCPEGILGLVASKLTETFSRPSVVLSTGSQFIKGSARSVSGVNITDLFSQVSDHLVDFGGHELAAGLTTTPDQLDSLRQTLATLTDSVSEDLLQKALSIELEIKPTDISHQLLAALKKFSPFGLSNPQPVFAATFAENKFRPVGTDGKHLKLNLIDGNQNFDAIGFNLSSRSDILKSGQPLQFAFSIEENTFRGNTKLQLKVLDFAKIATHGQPETA